jgi:hypothetical protein
MLHINGIGLGGVPCQEYLIMVSAFTPVRKSSEIHPSRLEDDDGFDSDVGHDLIRLLEENARLRALVTQLSTLVLKHVAEEK